MNPNASYPTSLPRGTIVRQVGAQFQTERTGLARSKEKFFGYYDDLIRGVPLTVYGSTAATGRSYKTPSPFHPSLLVYSSQITLGKGELNGIWDVEFRGLDPAMTQIPPPVYTLERTTGNEPLITHPKWTSDIAGTPAFPLNGAQFVST